MAVTAVQAESILKELGRVWAELGKDSAAEQGNAVMRSCAMTFLVASDEEDDHMVIGETIAALMHEHPSRAIVLRLRQGQDEEVEARVTAQCWMPFGGRQQVCCEQIELRSAAAGLDEVHSALLGLLVPDLPVVLWVRNSSLLDWPEFRPISALCDKLIFDTAGALDNAAVLRRIDTARKAGRNASDLEWTRTTRWGVIVAQFFDEPRERQRIPNLDRATIRYAGGQPALSVLYLAAWLRVVLKRPIHVELEQKGEGHGQVTGIQLCTGAECFAMRLRSECDVELRAEQQSHRTLFPLLKEYDLLREELRILGHDTLYDRVVTAALEEFARG